MKKRLILLGALAAFLSIIPLTNVFAANTPSIFVNSKVVKTEIPPILKNGVILVPVKTISELPNTTISWDNTTKTATVVDKTTLRTSTFKLNSKYVVIQKEHKEIPVPVSIVDGRVLVPLRVISEASGAVVVWEQQKHTVYIAKATNQTIQNLASNNLAVRRKATVSETPKIDLLAPLSANRNVNDNDVFYFPKGESDHYFYLYGDIIEYHEIKNNIDYKIWQAKIGISNDSIKLISNEEGLPYKGKVGVVSEEGTRPQITGEYVYYNMEIMGGIARYGIVNSEGKVTNLGTNDDITSIADFFSIGEE